MPGFTERLVKSSGWSSCEYPVLDCQFAVDYEQAIPFFMNLLVSEAYQRHKRSIRKALECFPQYLPMYLNCQGFKRLSAHPSPVKLATKLLVSDLRAIRLLEPEILEPKPIRNDRGQRRIPQLTALGIPEVLGRSTIGRYSLTRNDEGEFIFSARDLNRFEAEKVARFFGQQLAA